MDSKQQTLRLTGLPRLTQVEDVENFFSDRIKNKGRKILESVGPFSLNATSQTMQTTVSFSSHDAAQKALQLPYDRRRFGAVKGGSEHISLNHSFEDITTLHTSKNPETGRPDIDVVALHGLTGHAWNTFTTSELADKHTHQTREHNWLRDSLPRLLEQHHQQKIYSRVMSFGYNADVWMTKSIADLDVPVRNLIHYLDVERRQDPSRPLFFVGHSLGGIVIKQAIVELANRATMNAINPNALSQAPSKFSVKGCMFFGVPHKGADIASTASKFLSALSLVFNVNKNNVRDLEAKSTRFANTSSEFREVRSEYGIPIFSFYETVKYSRTLGIIVEEESAVYKYPGCPQPFGVNQGHSDMAKFSNADDAHALEPAVHFLATIAANAIAEQRELLHPTVSPPPPPPSVDSKGQPVENKYTVLESYDTVFLVDDSPSMRGEKWELVQRILDYSTVVATRYDRNGIDVHFMNNFTADQDNVRDPKTAVQLHRGIELRGNTPTLDRLSRHLRAYLQAFGKADYDAKFKGYNLIVLTDGEPNAEEEDEEDISDEEDAKKNKAAFRLIRKEIVNVAKKLDAQNAMPKQVGIQFCQIGNDEEATAFFKFLDDRLKGKYKLSRDMVDRVQCRSVLDLNHQWFEKLLLGAIDRQMDRKEIEAHDPALDIQDSSLTLAHRFESHDKGKERQWFDDNTTAGPSRFNPNRASTMQTLVESPSDDARSTHHFGDSPRGLMTSRRASPPSVGPGPHRRHTGFR